MAFLFIFVMVHQFGRLLRLIVPSTVSPGRRSKGAGWLAWFSLIFIDVWAGGVQIIWEEKGRVVLCATTGVVIFIGSPSRLHVS